MSEPEDKPKEPSFPRIAIPSKLRYTKSPHYTTFFANGVIGSNEPQSGMRSLVFYEDAGLIESETVMRNKEGEKLSAAFLDGDVIPVREQKARITVTVDTLYHMYLYLKTEFEDLDNKQSEKKDND